MRALRLPVDLPKNFFFAVFFVVLSASLASGQKNAPPKYDLQSEAKFKGTIEEVKLPSKGSDKDAAHLLLKVGADTDDIYLCPGSFLDDMGITFKKGDEIAVTGSKVKQDAADMILAREVVRGTDDLMLRDDKGVPIWNWKK